MEKSLSILLIIISLTVASFTGGTRRNEQIAANDTEAASDNTEITDSVQTTPKILAELGIVESEKLNSPEYVPMLDFFIAIDKARGCYSEEPTNLSYWYKGDTLSELDYLDDGKKSLLMSLYIEGRNRILAYDEIPDLELDGNITKREALLFVLRMIADTYSCVDSSFYTLDMDADTIYQNAYKKGLIESASYDDADEYITYEELCKILHKAIFLEYSSGGAAGVHEYTLYDNLIYKKEYVEKKESEPEPELIQIPVTAVINDDLTVEWTFPEEYSFISEKGYMTNIGFVAADKGLLPSFGQTSGSTRTMFDAYELIRYLAGYPDYKFTAIRFTYLNVTTNTRYFFDVDISGISVVQDAEEIKPGKYVRYKKSWCAKTLTLEEPYMFEEGCYYLLKDYDKTYRDDRYNHISYECFMAEETANEFVCLTNRSFGVSNLDEIHIQKITVSGNAKEGFVLTVSPESSDVFEVEESEESE